MVLGSCGKTGLEHLGQHDQQNPFYMLQLETLVSDYASRNVDLPLRR
jgi:hypothetical protein